MGTSISKTEYPYATPEQLEANELQRKLIELQTQYLQQQSDLTSKYAPQQESLLNAQLAEAQSRVGLATKIMPQQLELYSKQLQSGQQGLQLAQQAGKAYEGSLTKSDLQKQREDARNLFAKEQLAKLRGEKPYVSEQQETRISDLQNQYKDKGQQYIASLTNLLQGKTTAESGREGLRPSAMAGAGLAKELGRQTTGMDRAGRLLGTRLKNILSNPLQDPLTAQYQTSQQLGLASQAAKYDSLLGLYGNSVPVQSINMGVGGGAPGAGSGAQQLNLGGSYQSPVLNSTLAQMQQSRANQAEQTDIISSNKYGGAMQGGLSGATSGAMIGAQIGSAGSPVGTIIGAGIGLLLGTLAGYNS